MVKTSINSVPFLMLALALALADACVQGQGTRIGFYSRTCPRAESIIRSAVEFHFRSDPTLAAALLRMHFHDCFVHGCDASILVGGANTEKTAPPNLTVRGFEIIEDAKTKLEAACPGVVSCADILALAARDSVVLAGGTSWEVPTGRRDGRVSRASDTLNFLGPTNSIEGHMQKFASKGLDTLDFVNLNGGHTIGTTSCQFFQDRLYKFNSSNGVDPSIDPSFVPKLKALCPQKGDGSRRVAFDTGSQLRFDRSYFANLRKGRGVLKSDQELWTHPSTRAFVQRLLGPRGRPTSLSFDVEFGRSMVKMSNIEVKTGTAGEIRKLCSAIN